MPPVPPDAVRVAVAEPHALVPPLTDTALGTVFIVTVAEVPALPQVVPETDRAHQVPELLTVNVDPDPLLVLVPVEDVCQYIVPPDPPLAVNVVEPQKVPPPETFVVAGVTDNANVPLDVKVCT